MKKIIALAAVATLAGCSQAEPDTSGDTSPDLTAMAEPEQIAVDGGPIAGVYVATAPDGSSVTQTLTDDGKVTNTVDGEVVATGTYDMGQAENQACFTYTDSEFPDGCFILGEVVDGTWTATNTADAEEIWSVTRAGS
ncbi:hypothetical protein [Altererythrobacter aquiaggeris]|uniref:hypothetical protein n=1 Tax=Aestuarierythrobacter aquiaggeris TaxID=1898396 RepID=UPI0030160B45